MSVLWHRLPMDVFRGIVDFSIRRADEREQRERMTRLHLACEDGDLGLVAFLVKVVKVKKEVKDSRGETPLFKAVANGHFTTIRYLVLTAKVNLDSVNNDGLTVWHTSTAGDWWMLRGIRIVRFLVKEGGMAIDTPNADGQTVLHLAVMNSTASAISMVPWLVETRGANVNFADKDGHTALHMAAMSGDVAMASILLNHGASIEARNEHGYTALYLACERREHTQFCHFLVESCHANVHSACPSWKGTLLHACAKREWNVAKVELLIEKGVDVHAVDGETGETALHVAARLAWLAFAPTKRIASLNIIQALVQAGGAELVHAKAGCEKLTALHHASQGGRLDVVQCLVDGGGRSIRFINAMNRTGDTAVDLATARGHMGVVRFLTQAIANGVTP